MSTDSLKDEQETGDERVRDQHFAEIILSETLGQLSDVHPLVPVSPDDTVLVSCQCHDFRPDRLRSDHGRRKTCRTV